LEDIHHSHDELGDMRKIWAKEDRSASFKSHTGCDEAGA